MKFQLMIKLVYFLMGWRSGDGCPANGRQVGGNNKKLGFMPNFRYDKNMKFTRPYIKEQIALAIEQQPGKRGITIRLYTDDSRRSFLLSYDTHTNEITGLLECIGRASGKPTDIKTVLKSNRSRTNQI